MQAQDRSRGDQLDGRWGEEAAAWHARRAGAEVLASRVLARGGELDLVLCHRGALVFAEVKTRRRSEWALGAITRRKRARIFRAARAFLFEHGMELDDVPIRFDAFAVVPGPDGAPQVTWVEGAFAPEEGWT